MTTPIRQLARSAASLGVLQIGSMVLTLVVGILLARQLGPSHYGIYALAMAVTAFAGMLTEFGLPLLAMKEFARAGVNDGWGEVRGLVRWADRLILTISALVICGFLIAAKFWGFAEKSAFLATMIWAIILIPIVAIAKLRGLALLSLGHTFAGQFAVLILRPGLFALALAVIWTAGKELGPAGAMIWQVAAAACALLTVLALFLRYRPAEMRIADPVNKWREWLPVTIPMGMTEGLRLLQGQLAIFMLGILLTTESVGLFRVAEACTAVGIVSTTVLNVVSAPHFSRLFAAGKLEELQRVAGTVAFAISFLVAAAALFLTVFSEPLIVSAFGEEFRPSAAPLTVLMVGQVIVCLFGPVMTLCNMSGLQKQVVIGSALAVVSQLILALLLIPNFGTIGAALSVIVGMLVGRIFLTIRVKQLTGVDPTIMAFDFRSLFRLHSQLLAIIRPPTKTPPSENEAP